MKLSRPQLELFETLGLFFQKSNLKNYESRKQLQFSLSTDIDLTPLLSDVQKSEAKEIVNEMIKYLLENI